MPTPTQTDGPAPHEAATVPMSPAARVATLVAIVGPLVGAHGHGTGRIVAGESSNEFLIRVPA
jgi:hypothetical protein